MFQRTRLFLGEGRTRLLAVLLVVTGIANIAGGAFGGENAAGLQILSVAVFVIGAFVIVMTRLDRYERGRWLGILTPAFGAVVIGVYFFPNALLLFMGLAFGWVVAGLFLFRPRGPMQYQQAVKHLRRNEYAEAVKVMDALIKEEPDNPNHYRFRAEILRLWGKLDRARRDYDRMIQLAPDLAVAHNGLAEVLLQAGDYAEAHQAALRAFELAPQEWVAAYNLGMIEDRLERSADAVEHLNTALALRVPDARHRLLIHLYLARACVRLGDLEQAQAQIDALRRQQAGLREWRTVLSSDQAETLRMVLAEDVAAAEALIEGRLDVSALGTA
jgi:predicted Zn-dependent protease